MHMVGLLLVTLNPQPGQKQTIEKMNISPYWWHRAFLATNWKKLQFSLSISCFPCPPFRFIVSGYLVTYIFETIFPFVLPLLFLFKLGPSQLDCK